MKNIVSYDQIFVFPTVHEVQISRAFKLNMMISASTNINFAVCCIFTFTYFVYVTEKYLSLFNCRKL